MTNEELDIARAKEAARLSKEEFGPAWHGKIFATEKALETAARLAREGWTPDDPLLIEAREIVAREIKYAPISKNVLNGQADKQLAVRVALAALQSREPKP